MNTAQLIILDAEDISLRFAVLRPGDDPLCAVSRVPTERELLEAAGYALPPGAGDRFVIETRWRREKVTVPWRAETHLIWEDLGADLPISMQYRLLADAVPGRIF